MAVRIRLFKPVDAWRVADIFYDSVHAIDPQYYSLAQLNAWAPLPVDYAGWSQRLNRREVYVAEFDGELVGFTAMEADGYIDWIYTHSQYQHRGVASALYTHLEQLARVASLARLYVDASHLARPFFERRGFVVTKENHVERLGEILTNWSMEKVLV